MQKFASKRADAIARLARKEETKRVSSLWMPGRQIWQAKANHSRPSTWRRASGRLDGQERVCDGVRLHARGGVATFARMRVLFFGEWGYCSIHNLQSCPTSQIMTPAADGKG